jgi:hypothetical protein
VDAGATTKRTNPVTIKTRSPRREVATSEQPGRHERKAVDGVSVWNVSMVVVEPGEIVEINAITGESALP